MCFNSSDRVVSSLCPGRSLQSFLKEFTKKVSDCFISMGLPRGKSVLPIDPLKIKSPQNTKSSITKLRLPGECPGLKIIEKLKSPIVRFFSSLLIQ